MKGDDDGVRHAATAHGIHDRAGLGRPAGHRCGRPGRPGRRQAGRRRPFARRSPAPATRQRRLRRPALHDRARLRPGRQPLRRGHHDDRRRGRREAPRVQPRLPGRPRRARPDGGRAPRRVPLRGGDTGSERRSDRHAADEVGGHAASVVTTEGRPRVHRCRPLLGTPQAITDPDTSIEGWIQACFPLDPPRTCDGAFVVNEPMGAQSWFPSNNYPTDKATFDTIITVPTAKTALGIGELVEPHGQRRRHDHAGTGERTTRRPPI